MRRRPALLAVGLVALLAIAGCDTGAQAGARHSQSGMAPSGVAPSGIAPPGIAPPGGPPAASATAVGSGSASSSPIGSPASAVAPPATVKPTTSHSASSAPRDPAARQPFTATVRTLTAADLGASWHAGCPVGPAQLREISLSYWGFDNAAHTGRIVVNADVVPAVEKVFKTLYLQRFPIRSMRPVSEFGGSDDASMAADNTSAFNCRSAVAAGPPRWSAHAYGEAIDVNTVENPYLDGGKVLPPEGAPFAVRSPYQPGMAVAGGALVKAFAAVSWQWGGRWADPDYQHFSSTGG